ncbi:tetratricopeptide repeat protein [Streptomyces sp. NPDC018031]|uniref:tetratricopeptide repeat protein n=1 Tax=Streptomyces sp. NPDC018031 TaxID=3365033 RepID=UPI0037BC93BE
MKSIWTPREREREKTFARLAREYRAGAYEKVEAEARALAAIPQRPWRRTRPLPRWQALTLATGVAVVHGRGAEVLPELEALIAEVEPVDTETELLRLIVRNHRTLALIGQERHREAEDEALDVLRGAVRVSRLTSLGTVEINALAHLAAALCGQGRHEEAEAVARGNLPRAKEAALSSLHATLVRCLTGQGRYAEALAEARRFAPLPCRGDSGQLDLVTAEALHGQGRNGEAREAAARALADCERNLYPAHPRIRDARALLALLGEEPVG